jgi:hypothetical protein
MLSSMSPGARDQYRQASYGIGIMEAQGASTSLVAVLEERYRDWFDVYDAVTRVGLDR